MRAVVLDSPRLPLSAVEVERREPGPGEVRIRVAACGVCRTDLHIADGELPEAKLPLILGHQIVGIVEALGPGVEVLAPGDRVGVPWLGWTCGACLPIPAGYPDLQAAPLPCAGEALDALRSGAVEGAIVLEVATR